MQRNGSPLRLGLGPLALEDTLCLLQMLTQERLDAGDRGPAIELLRWLSQRAHSYPRYQLAQLRCQAVLARWEDKITQAHAYLLSASSLAAELHLPCERWPIQAALAEMYHSSGDDVRARTAAAQAAAILGSLAAAIDEPRLQAALLATRSSVAGS
jgi:hypothetical protein